MRVLSLEGGVDVVDVGLAVHAHVESVVRLRVAVLDAEARDCASGVRHTALGTSVALELLLKAALTLIEGFDYALDRDTGAHGLWGRVPLTQLGMVLELVVMVVFLVLLDVALTGLMVIIDNRFFLFLSNWLGRFKQILILANHF